MAKKQTTKKTTAEPVMYYAMLAPELPITVMDLEECFTAVPCFGIADLVIDFPGMGLKLGTDPRAIVETNEKNFLIVPVSFSARMRPATTFPLPWMISICYSP
jgi:hypothetical protein